MDSLMIIFCSLSQKIDIHDKSETDGHSRPRLHEGKLRRESMFIKAKMDTRSPITSLEDRLLGCDEVIPIFLL